MKRHHAFFAALCGLAVCLSAALAPAARADEPPPLLDDRDRATRLSPPPSSFIGPAATATDAPDDDASDDPPVGERPWQIVTAHSRWVSVPSFLLGALFDEHPSFHNVGFGIGVELGTRDDSAWIIELDWTPLIPSAGNWLSSGDPPAGASYVESNLHMLSVDVTHRWFIPIAGDFQWLVGTGLGVGVLIGGVDTTEVLPTCEPPVSQCAHWREATREGLDLPTRVVPILHLTTGFQYAFGDDLVVRLSAGFRDVFYAGLTVGTPL